MSRFFNFFITPVKKQNIQLVGVMSATLAMAVGILALAGCTRETQKELTDRVANHTSIVVIDNCQYIFWEKGLGNGTTISLTHKGNCTNHIHSYNK